MRQQPNTSREDQILVLSNEFARVELSIEHDANGPRLRVASSKTKTVGYLDPIQVEILSWLPPEKLTENLRTPFGPEDPNISVRENLLADDEVLLPPEDQSKDER